MKLECNAVVPDLGCDYVASGDTVDAVHDDMMAHGGQVHSDLMDGMSEAEMAQAGQEMSEHIKALVVANN